MKLVYMGDIHLRDKAPINRKDSYYKAQMGKLGQLADWAYEYDAPLLLGGDLVDTPKASARLLYDTIGILYDTDVITCLGNHDCLYHVMDIGASPVGLLEKVGFLSYFTRPMGMGENHTLHTVDWENVPTTPIPDHFNIFLGHVSVFKEIPHYWAGEGYTPRTLRKKFPGYDLYLCGDIHQALVDDNVVVSGSMMRMGIDQRDYKPRAYLIDTETMEIEPLYFDIKEDVFAVPEEKTGTELNLDGLVDALKESSLGRASYRRDCLEMAKGDERVKKIIGEIFDGLDQGT